jgi:hypothetical protein
MSTEVTVIHRSRDRVALLAKKWVDETAREKEYPMNSWIRAGALPGWRRSEMHLSAARTDRG